MGFFRSLKCSQIEKTVIFCKRIFHKDSKSLLKFVYHYKKWKVSKPAKLYIKMYLKKTYRRNVAKNLIKWYDKTPTQIITFSEENLSIFSIIQANINENWIVPINQGDYLQWEVLTQYFTKNPKALKPCVHQKAKGTTAFLFCRQTNNSFDFSNGASNKNENNFISIAFFIATMKRIYPYAAKIEKLYHLLVDTRFSRFYFYVNRYLHIKFFWNISLETTISQVIQI